MAQKMKVAYLDGTEVKVTATPKAQVETERFLRQAGGVGIATMVEAGFRLAFESSKPGIGNVGYEEWLGKITDVTQLCSDCEQPVGDDIDLHECPTPGADDAADPTPEAPSSRPSSD